MIIVKSLVGIVVILVGVCLIPLECVVRAFAWVAIKVKDWIVNDD